MGAIIYNGIRSDNPAYDIKVWTAPDYEIPERDMDVYHIPGRSGDLTIDYGSYKNVDRKYTISAGSDTSSFYTLAKKISEWLHTASGYAILQDTYEPDIYRLALPPKVEQIRNILGQAAVAELTFNCKPQRFLVSGDTAISITSSSSTIQNATNQVSKPIIKVYGTSGSSGSIIIGSYTVSISSLRGTGANDAVVIDSELQDCYCGSLNVSSTVTLASGFPVLNPGNNSYSRSGAVTKVEVIPKWWIV